ncbi:hypothetical protein D5S17_14800 [Pseudonocardiaceae bacterium YIM PH 21723]|nr:hypothetical protein D5S17_14800 [Pseudonocardiaceae bacterium YIM PH 21723]
MVIIEIELDVVDESPEIIDRLTRQLRTELSQIPVESAQLRREPGPIASKGDLVTVGSIVVAVANSALVGGVVAVLRTWINRHRKRSITVQINDQKLELSGGTPAEHQQVIDGFLRATETLSNPKDPREGKAIDS